MDATPEDQNAPQEGGQPARLRSPGVGPDIELPANGLEGRDPLDPGLARVEGLRVRCHHLGQPIRSKTTPSQCMPRASITDLNSSVKIGFRAGKALFVSCGRNLASLPPSKTRLSLSARWPRWFQSCFSSLCAAPSRGGAAVFPYGSQRRRPLGTCEPSR